MEVEYLAAAGLLLAHALTEFLAEERPERTGLVQLAGHWEGLLRRLRRLHRRLHHQRLCKSPQFRALYRAQLWSPYSIQIVVLRNYMVRPREQRTWLSSWTTKGSLLPMRKHLPPVPCLTTAALSSTQLRRTSQIY